MKTDVEEALAMAADLLSDLDDVPEAGEDFADSVRTKVESMVEWIEEHDTVTDKIVIALENMQAGVAKWLR